MERFIVSTAITLLLVWASSITGRKAGEGQKEFFPSVKILVVGK